MISLLGALSDLHHVPAPDALDVHRAKSGSDLVPLIRFPLRVWWEAPVAPPKAWGGHVWRFLLSLDKAPERVQTRVLKAMPELLPCRSCGKHFAQLLSDQEHHYTRVKYKRFILDARALVARKQEEEKK